MANPIPEVEAIEPSADAIGSDGDSAYDERTLSTSSITSSIYTFTKENGRTYHSYKEDLGYSLPNDELEQERMNIHYHAFRLAYGDKIMFAPLENPTSVIDIGTGTGIWAIDFADQYPGANVMGVDLSPIQPTYVPQNCSFEVMDVESAWDMPERFDLVHTRDMNGYLRNENDVFKSAFESLKPGGWIELQEFDFWFLSDDNTLPQDSAMIKWQTKWQEGIAKNNMVKRCIPENKKKALEDAGFTNVGVEAFKIAVGPWPKDQQRRQAGLLLHVGLIDGIGGISLRVFTQLLGWTPEQLEELLVDVRKELTNKKIHVYLPLYSIYGQKPA